MPPLTSLMELRAHVVVPFYSDGRWAANFITATDEPRQWQAREINLLETGAERVWLAVEKLRSEAALRDSEAQLRNILESINDGFFALDENWKFTYVNQAAERLTNRPASELIGNIFWEEFPGVVGSEFEQMHRGVMHNRVAASLIAFYPDHNRWYEVNSYPATNGITVYFRNVTAQIQAETALRESQEKLSLFIEHAPAAVAMFDREMRYLAHSRRWMEDYELTENIIGRSHYEVFPEISESWKQIHQKCLAGAVEKSDEDRFDRFDGSVDWLKWEVRPWFNAVGEVGGIVIFSENITARKHIEAEREQLLQQEQVSRENAERANRIKDEFLAVLSHELRSPLNPILGWTRLLQNGKLDTARQREALSTIERNAKLQTQLIEDLLDISRIIQGKLSLTVAPVSLTFVITAAIETVQLAAEAKNIQILLDLRTAFSTQRNSGGTVLVSGDAARLQQVMWNLLTNAVKFTPNGGQVTVELRQFDLLAQIRVIDTGIGIQSQFLPHVFEYFRQEDSSTTRKFGGLGLGLAIVRQIVEMHGGTVWAESLGEGQGATFTVRLPLLGRGEGQENLEQGLSERSLTERPLSGLRVLVVDDEPDMRDLIAFSLEQAGAEVVTVAAAGDALATLPQFQPDVLLSDIGMPDMDGYMLLRQIRALPPNRGGKTPAIALTAYAGDFNQQQALQAGFQQHLAKPVEPERLIETIVSLLGSHL